MRLLLLLALALGVGSQQQTFTVLPALGSAALTFAGNASGFLSLQPDACGVCGGGNQSCAGCDGVANSGLVLDGCGVCGGSNSTCAGCDGIPNSGLKRDGCGVCGGLDSQLSTCPYTPANVTFCCAGCDGVPNSGLVLDGCGICGGDNSTCAGCDGVANSGAVYDPCCVCNGTNTYASPCYSLLSRYDARAPYNPNAALTSNDSYTAFYTSAGQAVYDQCGECVGWGYNGVECAGCDGVPMSGLLLDGRGVCGGNCTSCPNSSCIPTRVLDVALYGLNAYSATPLNKPGIPKWTSVNYQLCNPEPGYFNVSAPSLWLVQLYGLGLGPFTTQELNFGHIDVQIATTAARVAITADTMVTKVINVTDEVLITYGQTSYDATRAASWAAKVALFPGVVAVTSTATTTAVSVDNNVTRLLWKETVNGTQSFRPLAQWPELLGSTYPFCTDITWRSSAPAGRLHGKRTGLASLGLIATDQALQAFNAQNLFAAQNVSNATWNPLVEGITDVVTTWPDLQCTCSPEWVYLPSPTAPTCSHIWVPPPPLAAGESLQRSAAAAAGSLQPGAGVVGGWEGITDGGGEVLQYYGEASGGSLAGIAARGPWRIGAQGDWTQSTLLPGLEDPTSCTARPAFRLVPSAPNVAAAAWATAGGPIPLADGFSITLQFQLSATAQRCDASQTLSGAMGMQISRKKKGLRCASVPGEGLALVLFDSASPPDAGAVGEGGAFLGYSGLSNSIAFEIDTRGESELGEPAQPHLSIQSGGQGPNSALHSLRLASLTSTAFASWVEDTSAHNITVSFVAGGDAVTASLNGKWPFVGGGTQTQAALGDGGGGGAGVLGALIVTLDGAAAPMLAAPLNTAFFLRPGGAGTAYVGVTASNGLDGFQAVDILSLTVTSAVVAPPPPVPPGPPTPPPGNGFWEVGRRRQAK